ncbi:MAG TPA: FAD-dependent oxidoreductase [Natronosporangium sp.]
MRVGVIGGGLAGALLAWRLAAAVAGDGRVTLVLGGRHRADATGASGGAVRGYEPDPRQCRLATDSLVELLASPTLQRWGSFQPVESVYLHPAGTTVDLTAVERGLPGSAELLTGADLAGLGWAEVPADAVAVRERRAGYLAPGRLREAVIADAAARRGVRLLPAPLAALAADDPFRCQVAGRWHDFDTVVIAAGAWTGSVLAAAGLPADGYRTKAIQYAIHRTGGWRPPQFVDELTGLYGRPVAGDRLLLGLPTDRWGVAPDRPPVTAGLADRAARLAADRFPKLRLGPIVRTAVAADCYRSQPSLSLQPVLAGRLFTFTGGAGGSVKTALAASREAVTQLVAPGATPALTPLGPSEGTS